MSNYIIEIKRGKARYDNTNVTCELGIFQFRPKEKRRVINATTWMDASSQICRIGFCKTNRECVEKLKDAVHSHTGTLKNA